ncbi:mechanosensitive ion channel family protein [Pseudoruegeria sp. SHC-113]|uniref:mechanosensitive ion channel family protein n=1 Tax=Pseudoruegeria sp. SHC-113 TaxID=2855439 RepID=UPI0021BB95DF|nr:mechanosensitive ion channel family protein [Pseudoruegeria sp. SHC-113]MCT8161563.1 mechanosensitive ion channel family protein [Pseudoruegeria sp. SHC-113]
MGQAVRHLLGVLFSVLLVGLGAATAQEDDSAYSMAPVIVDGQELFMLRGLTALPAELRAQRIADRIEEFAASSTDPTVQVTFQNHPLGREIFVDGVSMLILIEDDAEFDQVSLDVLALVNGDAVKKAIQEYRADRTPQARREGFINVALWTGGFVLIVAILLTLQRKVPKYLRRKTEARMKQIQAATAEIVRGKAVAELVGFLIRLLFWLFILVAAYYYVSFVLFSFAETRPVAMILITYISDPIFGLLQSIVEFLPNLVTLFAIFIATRYVLKMLRTVFENIEAGTLKFEGFETHWIWPTFHIMRALLLVFVVILSYPYVPGASSQAFQAVSILVGLMVSMGSNSVVSNALAGVFVLYRRSANVGDRIRVGDHTGDVVEIKIMETYIKSLKNELISIPNAQMLNSEVINYSTKIDGRGLLVHTTVGIGYDEPRQKIEALLLEAAARTRHIKKSPDPFVLRTALGDFAVNYQINGYTTRGNYLPKIVSELHANILDVFHSNGVQIMSPHYEGDPADAKIPPVPTKEEMEQAKLEAEEAKAAEAAAEAEAVRKAEEAAAARKAAAAKPKPRKRRIGRRTKPSS